MKKFFKWLVISIVTIVGLYFIIALFAPSTYKVERTKNMIASPEIVYHQISNVKNWNSWTAWARMDSTMVHKFEGMDGAVGSSMHWKGEEMGEGKVELTELIQNEKIGYKLTFIDWNSVSTGTFTISAAGDSTNVSWTNEGDIPFMMRTMALFMGGMDAMMGPDFESGLKNLDELTRDMKPVGPEIPVYEISTVSFPESQYIGIRFDTLISAVDSNLFSSAYGQIGAYLAENKIEMTGAPVCITYVWDDVNGRCELVAAIPVPKNPTMKKDLTIEYISFLATDALLTDYYGDYMNIWMAHMSMEEYRVKNNLKTTVSIEEYVTDPTTVSTYDSVLTKLYYLIEK